MNTIIDGARKLGFLVTLILIIISIIITFNTIRLAIYISREEISVMKLVGASAAYIKGPFVVGGTLYGLFAGLLTLAIFFPVTFWLGDVTEKFFIGLNVFEYYLINFFQITLIILFSGIIIGSISSYLAAQRYLKD